MSRLYGRRWNTSVEIAEDVFVDVTYKVERAEPDVGIVSDYVDIISMDPPEGLEMEWYDIEDRVAEVLTEELGCE